MLCNIAEIKRGFTTGADPWFYIKDITAQVAAGEIKRRAARMGYKGKPDQLALIESGDGTRWLVEKEYLFPVLKNPASYRQPIIALETIEDRVIFVQEPRDNITKKLLAKYLRHGETKEYQMGKGRRMVPAQTKTCQSRGYWYQLPDIKPARLFWQKAFDISHRHYLTEGPVLANQRFYPIYPRRAQDEEVIIALLNSTLTVMSLEFQRSALGLGGLEATVEDVEKMMVLDPAQIKGKTRTNLIHAFRRYGANRTGSVFEELGADGPSRVTLAAVRPERREMDRIIMGELLGLDDSEQLEVYRATLDLVLSRKSKATTVAGPVSERNRSESIIVEKALKSTASKVDQSSSDEERT